MNETTRSLQDSITSLLHPKSVAIVGASADRRKVGALPLAFLRKHGYSGAIYPINPKEKEIEGLPCLRSVSDLPAEIDLMVLAVAAERIPEVLEQCLPGSVKSALILSSGFAEVGDEGLRKQQELVQLASRRGIRLLGPNSVGIANLWESVVPTISQVFDQELEAGPVAFVTQSGALGTAITALAREEGVRLGYFVSTGNEADLSFTDFCEAFIEDPKVRVIGGYIEGVQDGVRFRQLARKAAAAGKPMVLLKVGRSEAAREAALSHTGALAGSDEAYQAVFEETGVVRAESVEELLDLLKMFSAYSGHMAIGGKVAVLSHSGGNGVLMADACVRERLDVSAPSPALAKLLSKRLPSYASLKNPMDLTANVIFSPQVMSDSVLDTLRSGEYSAAMLSVNLIWRHGEELADHLLQARSASNDILAIAWTAGPAGPVRRLNQNDVPVYSDPVRCVKAVAAKLKWNVLRKKLSAEPSQAELQVTKTSPDLKLRGFSAQEALLCSYQIPLAPARLVQSWEEARKAAHEIDYPVVVKVIAPELVHKSDSGGVIVGIHSEEELKQAYHRLQQVGSGANEGILVQKMVLGGLEMFAGTNRDPTFGPMLVFGIGGVYVEVMRETVIHSAPITEETAREIIESARFFPLLDGVRGQPPRDTDALARTLSNLSLLATREPVRSVDLNPIIALAEGAVAVDFALDLDEPKGGSA